jgi:hypothetical protein
MQPKDRTLSTMSFRASYGGLVSDDADHARFRVHTF